MSLRLKWILPVLLVFVAGQPRCCAGEPPDIRVGLVEGAQRVGLRAPRGAVSIVDLKGAPLAELPEGEAWQVVGSSEGVRVVNSAGETIATVGAGVRFVPATGGDAEGDSQDGVVRVSGVKGHWDGSTERDYRGVIEVRERGAALAVVNVVDVETYLRGVVPSEMPARYPLEALKAQAVAARGQALTKAGRHEGDGFDLCPSQHCQVYGGAMSEDPNTDRAVTETRGEVLEYNGRVADTLYSSNCGGHTASNEEYWPGQHPVPYLRGAEDFDRAAVPLEFPLTGDALRQYLKYAPPVYCNQPGYAKASLFRWWSVTPREELRRPLSAELGDFGDLLDVRVTDRADSGVVREIVVVGSKAFHRIRGGSAIRRMLGGLNSASFAIEPVREGDALPVAFAVWGAGWGHQVGMCQVGAAGLAGLGWDYRSILEKYYVGCAVVRRY